MTKAPHGPFLDPEVVPADVRRRAVRGVVLDGAGRCLLERVHLHADPGQGTWWELPGGGMEPGEDPVAALEREIAEETGLVGVTVGPAVATRRIRFRNRTRRIVDQHETIHLVDARHARRGVAAPEPGEAEDLLEVAWFDPDALASVRRLDPGELTRKLRDADGPMIPERLADLDCVGWSDERDGVPLDPAGAVAHVVDTHGRVVARDAEAAARVVRDAAPWTPTVHALLDHLEAAGFPGAPRALGIDVHGRDAVTYVRGDAGSGGRWSEPLRTVDGMAGLGAMLRHLRQAVDGFTPPARAVWMTGPASHGDHLGGSGAVVAHGDIGWTNVVWSADGEPALIDWEYAQPASPLRDLAQAACWLVPLLDLDHEAFGFDADPDRAARLRALAVASGAAVDEVLDEVPSYVAQETARLRRWGGQGVQPWARFHDAGWVGGFERITAFLAEHGASLS